MNYILDFFIQLWDLTNAMAPYILFGLLFAGVLHELVPGTIVTKHLGKNSIGSVVKATLFGIPLPVCSCGVIPLAASIQKSGANKGSVLSFLISTPITGVDSIAATYGMFGWIFTLYRVITSIFIAIIAGVFTNLLNKEEPKKSKFSFAKPSALGTAANSNNFTFAKKVEAKKRFSFIKALRYGFITLLGDIAKPLFWGLVLGALITMLIPEDLSKILAANGWLSYLIVITVAVPMYVCATASLPIAAAFILSGVSAGAAFVFLSAGPATNTVTIGVVKKSLGEKALFVYLNYCWINYFWTPVGLLF